MKIKFQSVKLITGNLYRNTLSLFSVDDFQLSQTDFTFNCQNRAHTVNITILNDNLFEQNQTANLQLVAGSGQSAGPTVSPLVLQPSALELIIIDEDRKIYVKLSYWTYT